MTGCWKCLPLMSPYTASTGGNSSVGTAASDGTEKVGLKAKEDGEKELTSMKVFEPEGLDLVQ